MQKECWNICCICWGVGTTGGCLADDTNPDICRLSHINLKTLIELGEMLYKPKDSIGVMTRLEEIKNKIKQKLPDRETKEVKEELEKLIDDLSKKDFTL